MDTTATATATPVFKGKLGFYPCTYEVSKKLRELNKYYFWMLGIQRSIEFKMKKQPQNRFTYLRTANKDGLRRVPWVKPEVHEIPSEVHGISLRARTPQFTADAVKPLPWDEAHIDALLTEARKYYAK